MSDVTILELKPLTLHVKFECFTFWRCKFSYKSLNSQDRCIGWFRFYVWWELFVMNFEGLVKMV